MKKPIAFILFLSCIIGLLTVVQVIVSNRLATSGVTLAKAQEELRDYKKENALLQQTYLEQAALTTVASQAAELGFKAGTAQVYLHIPVPLAQR